MLHTRWAQALQATNLPGWSHKQNVEPSTMLFDAAVAIIGAAFDKLEFFSGNGNIIVAYDGAQKRSGRDPPARRPTPEQARPSL